MGVSTIFAQAHLAIALYLSSILLYFLKTLSRVGDAYDLFLEKLRSEVLFLRQERLRQKMWETISHFDQVHITNLHVFHMFGAPINRYAVQKTMMLVGLSVGLIVIELFVYAQVKGKI